MKTRTRKHSLFGLSGLTLVVCAAVLLCLSCGGSGSSSNLSDPPAPAVVPLTMMDVTTVVQNAVLAVNAPMVVAVVDRGGNILAVFETPNAPTMAQGDFFGTTQQMVPADELAVGLARTAAYFSNDQAPLSSRTVRYISGIHFPPGVANTPNADLYGIENTNRGCTLSNNFLPGQMLNPSRSIDGTQPGLGIITGKADVYDSMPFAVNPGGIPLFKGGPIGTPGVGVVGGVGVVSTTSTGAVNNPVVEYAALIASAASGFLNLSQVPPPGVVIVGGIALPFVTQTTLPAGMSPGSMASLTNGMYFTPLSATCTTNTCAGVLPPEGYLVGPNASTANVAGALSASDVGEIVQNAINTAMITRAVIRLPLDSHAEMTISVADLDGTLLALYRMHDGTIFSTD